MRGRTVRSAIPGQRRREGAADVVQARVRLRKSPISYTQEARGTLRALGLRRINDVVRGSRQPGHARAWSAPCASSWTSRRSRAGAGPRARSSLRPGHPRRWRRREAARPEPAARARTRPHPRRPGHRGREGQDRRARHEGPEVPRRRAPSRRSSRAARPRCRSACPKLRGFKRRWRVDYEVVNVGRLCQAVEAGRLGQQPRQRPGRRDAGDAGRRRARPHRAGRAAAGEDPRQRRLHGPLHVVADAFTKPRRGEDRGRRRDRPAR